MGTVSVSLPSDGQTIDAADYNTPINTIVTAVNGNLDSDNIAEGGVVPNSLTDGTGTSWAWQSWTPTYSGITVGNGTVVAKYTQTGKTVHFYYTLTLGSTSAIAATATISTPVTASSSYLTAQPIGFFKGLDASAGASSAFGYSRLEDVNTIRPVVGVASSSYVTTSGVTNLIPFTWTTSDLFMVQGTYEAA